MEKTPSVAEHRDVDAGQMDRATDLSWQNNFRSLRIRRVKKVKAVNWPAVMQFASALVLWQMAT
jgi:hypothetical protein